MGLAKVNGGLGYRDFGSFNKALLAKQGWKLWQQPNSFLSKIMEAKYYRGGQFLDSNLGTRPSYAWRSIHSSRDLIKEGLIWRIGSVTQVRIWKDKWLPQPATYMVLSPPVLLDSNTLVCELIDRDTNWWNIPMLKNIFVDEEINLILSLPISVANQGDKQIWRGTKNGLFSVKRAYFIKKEMERKEEAESSSRKGSSRVWREIWKLKLPNAEKKFLWRACHEILPTRTNLHRRKIVEDDLCHLCGQEEETVLHVLWQCPAAADAWSVGCKKLQKWSSDGSDFLQLVEKAFNQCDSEEI
jgi:hypothetical protein